MSKMQGARRSLSEGERQAADQVSQVRWELERQISAPAIQFKGTGWYVTDYAGKTTKSEKSESESVRESNSDNAGKSEKKSKDSSPAKKTSDKPSSSKA